MQYSTLFLTSALAALAQAVEFTNPTFATITAGKPFEITWTEASGPVTIILKNGPPAALQTVSTIQSGLTGNTFTWNVPATLTQDTYALEIRDSTSTPNYSTQFELIGGVPASASASVSGTATPTGSNTVSQTGSTTLTGTQTAATTSTGSQSASGTATTASTRSLVTSTSTRASGSATSSPTSAPAGGMASGLTSNLALVFVAVGALFMIN